MSMQQMQRINVYALIRHCKDILETLQRRSVVEIENVNIEDSVFFKEDTGSLQASYYRSANISKHAFEIMEEYLPSKKTLLSSFSGRQPLSRNDYYSFVSSEQEILRVAYEIISYKKNITELEAEIVKYESQIEALKPWLNLDVAMTFAGTVSTKAFIGTLEGALDEQSIRIKLAQIIPQIENIELEIISSDENQTCVFVLCCNTDSESVSDALRQIGFSYPSYISKEIPRERLKTIEKHINKRKGKILELSGNIKRNAGMKDSFLFLEDYFVMKAERYSVVDSLSVTRHTFALTGYIPKAESEKLSKFLSDNYDAEVELTDVSDDDTPIMLKNNKFSEPVESVLATYSYPTRKEIDPTAIMAIFYYIFFGMMFSDAGYGLVMTIACAVALLKFKNMEQGLKKSVKMFFFCGISTTFWGLMFGSFFGNAVSVICTTFLHMSAVPAIPGLVSPLWFDPVSDPMRMLMFAFLLGIIHLFSGLFLQAVIHVKNRDYLAVVYDVVSWYLLVGGGILALLSLDMMKDIAGFVLPSVFLTIGGIMAALGAVIILLFSGRDSKNPVKRLLKGAYGLYGATGYLSDILSYSRLLALGLATGVIAQVFNQIGSMIGGSVFGLIVFTIVFLIGHTLNIGINALGAYVHTNRLQFVEFFGKFYEGGGRVFKPFKENTKHFTIKEDI